MNTELKRTYVPFKDRAEKSKQTEYTESTPLLKSDGTLNAKGWVRHNVFEYDRSLVKRERLISKKEWDYYTVTDGQKQLLVSFANVGIGGFMGLRLRGRQIQHDNEPTFDNRSDVDLKIVARMNCHQIYGIWNGNVTLDDGRMLEIKDLFAFCEYVENRW